MTSTDKLPTVTDASKNDAEEKNLSHSDVVTKYHTAAKIANDALQMIISNVKTGVSVLTLCKIGDEMILEETGKIYNKKENGKKVYKGIAFPTCISLNEICDNFAPLDDTVVISDGDLVKISLACHIDGYVAPVSHTIYNGAIATGRAADVIMAASMCIDAALRSLQVGNSSLDVSRVMEQVASEFNCTTMIGSYSHEIKQHIIEGSRYFASTTKVEDKVDSFKFGINEAYSLNVFVSTGEGKPKTTEYKTTIYRAEVQNRYTLKTQLGRAFISQVNSKYPAFPFNIRSFEEERVLKAGLPEAIRHSLVTPYNVMAEKNGELVAHFKVTVLLLAGGVKRLTGLPLGENVKSDKKVMDENLKKLLASPINPKHKKTKSYEES